MRPAQQHISDLDARLRHHHNRHVPAAAKGLKIIHVHPSHRMGINARRGLDSTLQYIRILSLIVEENTNVADDLEAHTLLVLAWECWCGKGLGDKVGGPTAQLDIGVGCGERQDSHHDLRVVGLRVAKDGLFGILQLLELLAHRLHVGGSHVGGSSCRQASRGPRKAENLPTSTLRGWMEEVMERLQRWPQMPENEGGQVKKKKRMGRHRTAQCIQGFFTGGPSWGSLL